MQRKIAMSQKFHKGITFERFDKFISKNAFADVNLYSKLYKRRVNSGITLEANVIADLKRVTFGDALKGQFKPAKVGDSFGPSWSTVWFRIRVELPDDLVGKQEYLEFHWDADCEGMIWSKGSLLSISHIIFLLFYLLRMNRRASTAGINWWEWLGQTCRLFAQFLGEGP